MKFIVRMLLAFAQAILDRVRETARQETIEQQRIHDALQAKLEALRERATPKADTDLHAEFDRLEAERKRLESGS